MNGAVCGYGTQSRGYCLTQFQGEAFCLWEPDEDAGATPIGVFAYNHASSYPDRNEGPGRTHATVVTVGTFGGSAVSPIIRFFQAQ